MPINLHDTININVCSQTARQPWSNRRRALSCIEACNWLFTYLLSIVRSHWLKRSRSPELWRYQSKHSVYMDIIQLHFAKCVIIYELKYDFILSEPYCTIARCHDAPSRSNTSDGVSVSFIFDSIQTNNGNSIARLIIFTPSKWSILGTKTRYQLTKVEMYFICPTIPIRFCFRFWTVSWKMSLFNQLQIF